jgi:murein DD-endopeptidase MepM/ murein hydrolase activator NlpD
MDGIVTYTGWMGGYGRLVVIKHRGGYSTRYGHLSRIAVRKGKYVRQGQRIGYVGNTGRSKGAHLHFEIREGGKAIDPMTKIK